MADEERAGYLHVHENVAKQVRQALPEETALYDLADLFKVFADTTRIKILYALLRSEMCVYDIALLFDMGQSATSHQLRILKASKLIKCRRQGKKILYSLADDHVRRIIDQGLEHIKE